MLFPPGELFRGARVVPTDHRIEPVAFVVQRQAVHAHPGDRHGANLTTLVELANARPFEVSIEVSERALRRYGLTFDQVAAAVRRSSLDLPGGSVKTAGGEILLRTRGQAYDDTQFAAIPLRGTPDGRQLRLGDLATIRDGFDEEPLKIIGL